MEIGWGGGEEEKRLKPAQKSALLRMKVAELLRSSFSKMSRCFAYTEMDMPDTGTHKN